jgi:hypothetical protein
VEKPTDSGGANGTSPLVPTVPLNPIAHITAVSVRFCRFIVALRWREYRAVRTGLILQHLKKNITVRFSSSIAMLQSPP